MQGPYVASRLSLRSEQRQDQPEVGKKPGIGHRYRFLVVVEAQNPAGFFQGNRCELRSVVGVMQKGRTQLDSEH